MRILLTILFLGFLAAFGQQLHTASFVAKLGTDTVIVETYNMLPNHLYGKAFLRYPEDKIGVFDIHFNQEGSIRHYSMSFMKPDSSYISVSGTEGLYCENDTCAWFASWKDNDREYINKRQASKIDFIGGWTPTLSLIEWNCIRLIESGQSTLPITMINDYIGIKQVSLTKGTNDTLIFGGDFLEYAKLTITPGGRITAYDGTGTPWNYIVTRHSPIDVDQVAKRMSGKPPIGVPSPAATLNAVVGNDTIRLTYGRPFKRGRVIFGGIVPYDSIWRTGANGPTQVTLPHAIRFGKTIIPKGQYALYTIPARNKWTLIFNTDLSRWPTEPNRSKDFAAVPLKVREPKIPADQFTIQILPEKKGATIQFTWDQTEAYASFTIVKDKQ